MTTEMFTILLTDSLKEKAMFILRATFQHAKNLAFLTTIYKTILLILKKLQGRTLPVHNFIGAFVAGYFVFGENNKVNMQVNKSCTSILYTIMILRHVFRSICIYCRGSALVWLGWPWRRDTCQSLDSACFPGLLPSCGALCSTSLKTTRKLSSSHCRTLWLTSTMTVWSGTMY